jgi:8-oxo-dGTP diphosphatase
VSSREYPARPLVGIGVAVLRPDAVLLARRGRAPALGQWSLPGGAQRLGETAEEAARRELMEETGLSVGALHLVANVDSIHRDEDGRVQYHYTILDFAAAWQGGEPRAQGDVTDARFVAFADLESLGLWSEALRVIRLAQRALSSGGGASGTAVAS